MKLNRYIILFFAMACVSSVAYGQKEIRQQIIKGNKAYNDSIFRDAEIAYRKAIDASPKEQKAIAHYNLGNTLYAQSKKDEALKEYEKAEKATSDNNELASIYHNMGVVHQDKKEFDKAIENYKKSLMKNPKDDETRYNLAMLLKNQENQQQQDKEDKKDDKKEDKKDDKKDQNKDQNKDQKKDDKDKKEDKQDQQQQQQEMSKDAAEQLLQSVLQDEKKTQEKVQKQQALRGDKKREKQW